MARKMKVTKRRSFIRKGSIVRLLHEFKNGKNMCFPAGTTGILVGRPNRHLYEVYLAEFKHSIMPLRLHIEKV